ncbi:MAG: hypothetical protein ACRDP3_15920 [Streptomyces sp.]|uniref:hypothetical protein n=1 Tax=Streptomyces sp. TaxID=1931 RepID=UPI003D6AC20F
MTDRSRRRAAPSDTASREDNPFAAPPEGRPDQPWQPRRGANSEHGTGTGTEKGAGPSDGSEDSDGSERSGSDGKPSWGSQWSSRQPGRQSGGFGNGPGNGNGNGGNGNENGPTGGGPGKAGRGMRWDPTDPLQRHARYSLHSGIWALFFALFSLPQVALLLGALSLYWGINSLRGGPSGPRAEPARKRGGSAGGATAEDIAGSDRTVDAEAPKAAAPRAPAIPVGVTPAQAAKSRTTAAVSGLITAALALAVVAATFTFQMIYSDYYSCTQDALTTSSRADCKELLPSQLRPLLENR